MKFALLASGSKGNACLIKSDEQAILIDCGTTQRYLKEKFDRIQFDYHNVSALLITHTHQDHVKAINMFKHIPVYADRKSTLTHHKKVDPFEVFHHLNFTILPLPVSHDSHGSLGYVIESEGERLVYITDTGYINEELYTYIANAEYYIFESNHDVEMLMETNRPWSTKQRILSDEGHLCNEDSAFVLANVIGDKTKEIVLAHLSEEGNSPQQALGVLYQTLANHGINTSAIRIRTAKQDEHVIGGN